MLRIVQRISVVGLLLVASCEAPWFGEPKAACRTIKVRGSAEPVDSIAAAAPESLHVPVVVSITVTTTKRVCSPR